MISDFFFSCAFLYLEDCFHLFYLSTNYLIHPIGPFLVDLSLDEVGTKMQFSMFLL